MTKDRYSVFHEMAREVANDPEFIKRWNDIMEKQLKKMGKTWEQLFDNSTKGS